MTEQNEFEKREQTIKAIQKGLKRWEQIAHDPHYDKKGWGFNLDSRFCTAKIELILNSWDGVYGNSGCSTFFYVGDDSTFKTAFVRVLNLEKTRLMQEVIKLIESESQELKEKEITRLRERLAELEAQ